jgi:hypothetical protein
MSHLPPRNSMPSASRMARTCGLCFCAPNPLAERNQHTAQEPIATFGQSLQTSLAGGGRQPADLAFPNSDYRVSSSCESVTPAVLSRIASKSTQLSALSDQPSKDTRITIHDPGVQQTRMKSRNMKRFAASDGLLLSCSSSLAYGRQIFSNPKQRVLTLNN